MADERQIWVIPHFLDVVTNLAFLIPGIWGLHESLKVNDSFIRRICLTLFSGFLLLTFGSGYYHWDPNNFGLLLDRIPISIIVLSFFLLIVSDCTVKKWPKKMFFPLMLFGVLSPLYWYFTELYATGDLRPYVLVQFFPVVAIPIIILLRKKNISYIREIYFIYAFFTLAKISEALDEEIYEVLKILSGHNLKHIFMAIAGIYLVLLIKNRNKIKEF